MILKGQPISFDKKSMPPYIIKFNAAMIAFFAAWFVLCLPALIAVGYLFGESAEFYITLGVLCGVFFIGIGIFYLVGLKLRERLVGERAAELEEKFSDMPLDKATEILKERGVITEYGFVSGRGDVFGAKIVPFDKAQLFVFGEGRTISVDGRSIKYRSHPLKIDTYAEMYDGVDVGEADAIYELDGALFNFIDKRELIKDYEENRGYCYLKTDKKNFVRACFGFKLK